MMGKLLVVLAITVLLHGEAEAADKSGTYTAIGTGIESCGTWTAVRRKGGPGAWQRHQWVMGYVTAYNRWVHPSKDVSGGTDAEGMEGWIDNYCRDHPLEDLDSATVALILHLRTR